MPKNKSLSSVNGGGRRWASVNETAAHLGVTPRTIRQMVSDGRIVQYANGKRLVRYDLNEIDAAMTPRVIPEAALLRAQAVARGQKPAEAAAE